MLSDYFAKYTKGDLPVIAVLALVTLGVHLINLGMMPLIADEGIRATVSLEMLISGNWLEPTTWGEPYYYKTPLYNWIVAAFFYLFGSSEFVFRLPSVLALFGLGLSVFVIARESLGKKFAAYAAFAFVLSGRILTRDSMLGHIDLFFSLVTFWQIYSIYFLIKKKDLLKFFVLSYGLMALGVLMKGFPSILFQVLSLAIIVIESRSIKPLLRWQHLLGILLGIVLVAAYFIPFALQGDEQAYLDRLMRQSSEPTLFKKHFMELFIQLFKFPFEQLLHLFPTSIFLIILSKKGTLKAIWQNQFLRFTFWAFVLNVIPYYLSPGYYPRYLFMLYPLLFIIAFYLIGKTELNSFNKVFSFFWRTLLLLMFISIPIGAFLLEMEPKWLYYILVFASIILCSFMYLMHRKKAFSTYVLAFASLLLFRLIFDLAVIPYRVNEERGSKVQQKEHCERILEITEGKYIDAWKHVPLSENFAFYIEREKMRIIRKTYDLESGIFYLIPSDASAKLGLKEHYRFKTGYMNSEVVLVYKP